METMKIQAEVRTECGKGPVRKLRAQGKLPAVMYGRGRETISLTIQPKEIEAALRSEKGRNMLLEVVFGDSKEFVLVRDVAVEPVSRELVHVDFYCAPLDRSVDVIVPFTTHGRAIGVQRGGKLSVPFRTLPVRCTPDKIPTKIDVDVSAIDMGQTITVEQLNLPEGVSVLMRPQQTVALVFEERIVAEEETATPGAAAAPAAKAAKAPAKK